MAQKLSQLQQQDLSPLSQTVSPPMRMISGLKYLRWLTMSYPYLVIPISPPAAILSSLVSKAGVVLQLVILRDFPFGSVSSMEQRVLGVRSVMRIEWTWRCPMDQTFQSLKARLEDCLCMMALSLRRVKVRLGRDIPEWALKKTAVEGSSGTVAQRWHTSSSRQTWSRVMRRVKSVERLRSFSTLKPYLSLKQQRQAPLDSTTINTLMPSQMLRSTTVTMIYLLRSASGETLVQYFQMSVGMTTARVIAKTERTSMYVPLPKKLNMQKPRQMRVAIIHRRQQKILVRVLVMAKSLVVGLRVDFIVSSFYVVIERLSSLVGRLRELLSQAVSMLSFRSWFCWIFS